MRTRRKVPLNLTKEQAEAFLDWLANDTYWGHTWCAEFEHDDTVFVINGHTLDTYSNLHHQVIIDGGYVSVNPKWGSVRTYLDDYAREYTNMEYALMRLGYTV